MRCCCCCCRTAIQIRLFQNPKKGRNCMLTALTNAHRADAVQLAFWAPNFQAAATDDSQQRPIATQRNPSPDAALAYIDVGAGHRTESGSLRKLPKNLFAFSPACGRAGVCARKARLQKRRRSSAAQGQSARRLRAVWTGKLRSEAAPGCASKADGCRFIFGAPQDRTANRADPKGPTPGPSIVRLGGHP